MGLIKREPATKETIRVIHYSDTEGYLASLLRADIISPADLVCSCCGTPVSAINFGGLTRLNDKLIFSCDKETCLMGMAISKKG